ncbi:MAG: alpha/beta hydrolase [Thermoplasmata archaeon]
MTIPSGQVRAGVVALNPAGDQSKDQILMRHLTQTLPSIGIATVRFDRRPKRYGWNVSFAEQADDALAALRDLIARVGNPSLPGGIWGWGDGASAGAFAAAHSGLPKFLILIACSGVSPAEQMRYGTAEHLRRAGFGEDAQAELLELRLGYESAVRGTIARGAAQKIVNQYAARPWFPIAWVPRRIQPRLVWPDMDYNPRPVFSRIVVPTLLFYGETDEWSPINSSLETWRIGQQESQNQQITIVRPRGTAHVPTIGSGMNARAISPDYTYAMIDWLKALIPRINPRSSLATPATTLGSTPGNASESRLEGSFRRAVTSSMPS